MFEFSGAQMTLKLRFLVTFQTNMPQESSLKAIGFSALVANERFFQRRVFQRKAIFDRGNTPVISKK